MIQYSNLEQYIIQYDRSIYDLIKKINLNGKGFAIVLCKEKKIIGLFTDGDIRRLLLKKIDLNSSIKNFIKKRFIYINQSLIDKKYSSYKNIKQVPIVDKNKKLIGIYFRTTSEEEEFIATNVFILAGGLGKRMGHLTKKTPKPMLKINKKPILENIILSFKKRGFINFTISTNYLSNKITSYFKDGSFLDVNINYIKEKKFLGTAGPLTLLDKKKISNEIFVINGDVYSNLNYSSMLKVHRKRKDDLTVCAQLYTFDIPYGLIANKSNNNFLNEKPTLSYLINSGIYIINKKLIKYIKNNTFLDMNDFLNLLKKKRFKIGIYTLYESVLDIGSLKQYKKLKKNLSIFKN
jgi:dTDP-glucose pyrophosphorylase